MKKKILSRVVILFLIISTFSLVACSKEQNSSNFDFEVVDGKFEIEVVKDENSAQKKIELGDGYDYDLYYYKLGEVNLVSGGKSVPLEEALENNIITLEEIVQKAKSDFENNDIEAIMIKDGGSMLYCYPKYTILKYNSIDGRRDVVIGDENLNMNDME